MSRSVDPSLPLFVLELKLEKIEEYLRFLTHAGETKFPIFDWGNFWKLCHRNVADVDINTENSKSFSGSNLSMKSWFSFLFFKTLDKISCCQFNCHYRYHFLVLSSFARLLGY